MPGRDHAASNDIDEKEEGAVREGAAPWGFDVQPTGSTPGYLHAERTRSLLHGATPAKTSAAGRPGTVHRTPAAAAGSGEKPAHTGVPTATSTKTGVEQLPCRGKQ